MTSPSNKYLLRLPGVRSIAILALCFATAESFYSVLSKGNDPTRDYTHKTITHEALLRVVARFLEENPRPGSSISPGDLLNLDPLTSTSLFNAYYGEGHVSAIPLEEAIGDVVRGNLEVDMYESILAESHFNADRFKKGNRRLKDIRQTVIKLIQSDDHDYQTTRELVGTYLHILQDFYSNSNWVEMRGGVAYEDLGLKGVEILQAAERKNDSCKDCDDSKDGNCDNNLIIADGILTSGYKSTHGIKKPTRTSGEGKCAHGGRYDDYRLTTATGGINKESRDFDISPHNALHEDAAMAAKQATENFFLASGYGLRDKLGDEVFMDFFNLRQNSLKSLSIAMDVTGSMSNDIEAAKEECYRLINQRVGTVNEPANYVLVPFSDPGYGPVSVTTDPEEFKASIESLTANGGGDCPELSMKGTELAIINSLPGSDVFVFTDADAKDSHEADNVAALAVERDIIVTYLLTGECGYSYKRSINSKNYNDLHNKEGHSRSKRSPDPSYQTIADTTGGSVFHVSKGELKGATELINLSFQGAEVNIRNIDVTGSDSVVFPVDSTMSQITIRVTAAEGTTNILFDITDPSGTILDGYTTLVNSPNNLIIVVNASAYGEWRLGLHEDRNWNVVINATSPIDFLYTFYTHDASGQMTPLQGNPGKGQDISLLVDITGAEYMSSITRLVMKSQNGADLKQIDLSAIGGNSYLGTTTVPNEDFNLQLQGIDVDSNIFHRTRIVSVTVQSVSISMHGGTKHTLDPAGNATRINFTISNHGDQRETIPVTIESDSTDSFIQDLNPSNMTIEPYSTSDGYIIAAAPENTTGGTLRDAKLVAKGNLGASNSIQFKLIVMDDVAYYRSIDEDEEDYDDYEDLEELDETDIPSTQQSIYLYIVTPVVSAIVLTLGLTVGVLVYKAYCRGPRKATVQPSTP